MEKGRTLIFTAMELEARAIAKEFGVRLERSGRPTPLPAAELHIIGIRATKLPRLDDGNIEKIIMAGVAGALDPKLKIGQIIVDFDFAWPDSVGGLVCKGMIYTADDLVSTPRQKAELFNQTGAAAVDMETSIVRSQAARQSIPVGAIRGISDTANDAVSPELLRWIDATGRIKPMALAGGLATRPTLIPSLMRLGRRTNEAMANVAKVVHQLISSTGGPPVAFNLSQS